MTVPGASSGGAGPRLQALAIADTIASASAVRVSDVLALPGFVDSKVVAGAGGLQGNIEHVNVIQIPTDRFVKRDELVLTPASTFRSHDGDVVDLIQALMKKGISALAVRGRVKRVLGRAMRLLDENDLPLIELSTRTHLSELQTQVLEMIVRARTRQLKAAESIRDQLAEQVLRGGGVEAVVDGVASVVEGDVVLVGRSGEVLAASAGADHQTATSLAEVCLGATGTGPCRDEDGWIVWPVLSAGNRLGCLIARTTGDYNTIHHAALQHGATDAALQILHREEAAEADARLKAGFLRDLLVGSVSRVSALRRAAAIGWDARGSFSAVVVGSDREDRGAVLRGLRATAPGALVTERRGASLAMVPDPGLEGTPSSDGADRLGTWTVRSYPGAHVGISAIHTGLEEMPTAVEEAREALRTARIFDRRTPIRRYEDLGALLFLSHVPVEELLAFERSVLAPLEAVELKLRASLLKTLRILIESNLNAARTARSGGWHYNTVRNRVARLSQLFGPLRENGAALDAVRIALLIQDELGDSAMHEIASRPPPQAQPTARSRRADRKTLRNPAAMRT